MRLVGTAEDMHNVIYTNIYEYKIQINIFD